MHPLLISDVVDYVEHNIATFHEQRLNSLDSLKLSKVLSG
jgi:hypothetical protein